MSWENQPDLLVCEFPGVTYIDTAGPQISARKGPSGLEYALRKSVPKNRELREHRLMRLCSQRIAREPRENCSRSMSGAMNPLLSSGIPRFDLLKLPLFARLLKGDSSTQAVSNRFVVPPTVSSNSIKHCQWVRRTLASTQRLRHIQEGQR